ncbi:MAG: MFS transporter [Dehalococcoidia bacterium]
MLSLRALARPTHPPRATSDGGGRSQHALLADGLLASASDAVLPFLPLYLVFLGATTTEVGLLSILSGLAGLVALVPGAWLAEHARSLKVVVLLGGGGVARLGLLALAAIPFALDGQRAVFAILAVAGVRALVNMIGHPSWVSIFAAVVPADGRAKYAARRSLGGSLVAMAAVPLMGLLVSRVGGVSGYQVAFLVATGIGFMSTACYAAIREPRDPEAPVTSGGYRSMLVDARFSRFLLTTGVLHTSSLIAAPFFIVHLSRTLGGSAALVGTMSTVEAVAAVAGQAVVGTLVTRFGSRRVFIGSMTLMPAIPLLWLVIDAPWQAAAPYLLTGLLWAMCNLAAFDLLLQSAPRSELGRYAAAQQAMVLLAGFLGPVVGTAIMGVWGAPALFAVSAAGRALALATFVAPRPRAERLPLVGPMLATRLRRAKHDAVAP